MRASIRKSWIQSRAQLLAWGLIAVACADSEFKADSKAVVTQDAVPEKGTPLIPTESSLPAAVSKKPDTLTMNFPASQVKDESLKFTLDVKGVSAEFTLKDINKDLIDERAQITRTALTQAAKQGTPGTLVQEMFDQTFKKSLLDLLVVIDNSGSMSEEQANLSNKLSNLLSAVADSDWQIGVITSSPVPNPNNASDPGVCMMTLIKANQADAATIFASAVRAGINGSGNEQGFRQARVGLECKEAPWVRANSTVAVLIVSDEDNCSDGNGCGSAPWASHSFLTDYVKNTLGRTLGKNAGYYGIFSPPENACNTAPFPGVKYKELVQLGVPAGTVNYGNICDQSYATTLNRISSSISRLLTRQFELKATPSSTPIVKIQAKNGSVTTVAAGVDYNIAQKTLTFVEGKEPPLDSKILVEYRVGSTPMFSQVILASPPAPGTVSVSINGASLNSSSFSVNGSTVVFGSQPPALADVVINYRLDQPLTQQFTLTKSPLANSLKVSVNGAAVNNFSYDAAANQVSFASPPTDGAKISFSFTYREGPQLDYPLPIMPGAFNVKILDGVTPVSFTEKEGVFSINPAMHQAGKKLVLEFELPDATPRVFTLAHMPIENSALFQMAGGDCNLGAGIELIGNKLTATCGVKAKTEFTLNYKFRDAQTTYAIEGIKEPERGTWLVFIDGEATSDYERIGSTIKLNFEPLLDSKITIQYTFPE